MLKILSIIPQSVFPNAPNAGAITANFYLEKLDTDTQIDFTIIHTGDIKKDNSFEKMQSHYKNSKIIYDDKKKSFVKKLWHYILFNFFFISLKYVLPKYYVTNSFQKNRLIKLFKLLPKNYIPDIILVHFPPYIFEVKVIKKRFPNVKIIADLHDVTSQSAERFISQYKAPYLKWYLNKLYKFEKKILSEYNSLIVLSHKDKELLINRHHFEESSIMVISPFFNTYLLNNDLEKNSFVFLGMLSRPENYKTVDWFIQNVWLKYGWDKKGFIFHVIGKGAPDGFFEKYNYIKNINFAGFVPDLNVILSGAFAMVSPLVLGAGIKIKVLEGLASGIPVITNEIGIEGIPAIENRDFFLAKNEIDYNKYMEIISSDKYTRLSLIANGRKIMQNFDYNNDSIRLINFLKSNGFG